MTTRTRISHGVWTGAPSTLQRAPSTQRPSRRAARRGEEKEIEFISTTREVAKAREPGRGHAPHWDDVLTGAMSQAQQRVDINDLISYVKGSGLRNREGEAGYVLKRLTGTAFEPGVLNSLTPTLRDWFDEQLANMEKVLADAKREVEKRIQKLKARGDYTSADILRIKTSEYPNWSTQYIAALNKLQKVKAKGGSEAVATEQAKAFAKVRAKTTGVDLGNLTEKQVVSLKKASAEKAIEESLKLGLNAEQLMAIRVTPKSEREVFLEAYAAREKGITIAPETVEKPIVTIEATTEEKKKAEDAKAEAKAQGMSCYTQLYTYKVALKDGEVILVEALSESSAKQKAKDAGYKPAWATRMMSWETIEPKATPTGAYKVTTEDGKVVTMLPFIDPNTKDTLLLPKDAVQELKNTTAYAKATGTEEQKLGIAYANVQKQYNDWLMQLQEEQPDLYKVYETQGYEGLMQAIETLSQEQKDVLTRIESYKGDEGYRLYDALTEGAITQDQAKQLFGEQAVADATKESGELEEEFKALSPGKQQDYIKNFNIYAQYTGRTVPDKAYDQLARKEQTRILEWYAYNRPEYWKQQARATGKIALGFVPIAGTIAYWKDMSTGWRIFSIATDVICVGALIHAAAAGARAARGYTVLARMKGSAAGAGQMVLAQVTAPAEIIAHPIQTAKGIGKQVVSAIETLVHPKKVPLGAAELAYTTARLPVEDVGDAAKAMQLRDAAVDAAIHGKQATVTVGNISLTLTPAELQKVVGAMAVHATPDIRPYLNGTLIKSGAEGSGVFISPNFHSRFAQATAFGDIPEGGIRGGLIIRDESVLKAIVPSGKVYKKAAEIEAVLKAGTALPPPSQILFTRDVAGNKLTLLVIGEPFTQAQIAKLKVLGSLDTIGQIFKPTMKLTGAERTAINSMDDIIQLARERAALARELAAAQTAGRLTVAQGLGQRIADVDNRIADLIQRVNTPREAIRPSNVVWAQYTDKGILDRWRELNPREVVRTPEGTRLPDIRTGDAIRRAALIRERRGIPAPERGVPAGERRIPPEGRRVPPERRLYSPTRAPQYAPPYTPAYAPPYTPSKPPAYAPPYAPPRVPPRRVPPSGPSKPPVKVEIGPARLGLGRERIPTERPGSVVWKQGMYYVQVIEPYRTTGTKPDVIYSRHRPPGAVIGRGKQSPQKTLRAFGRRHPRLIKLPMGAVSAHVKNGKRLRFQRRG